MSETQNIKHDHIVFYDGDCALCIKSVQIILKNNPRRNIFFCSLQSEKAVKLLSKFGLKDKTKTLDTLVYVKNRRIYLYADAVLQICKQLKFPYNLFQYLAFLPAGLNKIVYQILAKNRHHFSKKKQKCTLPSEDYRNQFV